MKREKSAVTVYKNLISRCKNKTKKNQNHRFTSLPGPRREQAHAPYATGRQCVYRIVKSRLVFERTLSEGKKKGIKERIGIEE